MRFAWSHLIQETVGGDRRQTEGGVPRGAYLRQGKTSLLPSMTYISKGPWGDGLAHQHLVSLCLHGGRISPTLAAEIDSVDLPSPSFHSLFLRTEICVVNLLDKLFFILMHV